MPKTEGRDTCAAIRANYRWRCRDCFYQFTVKTGSIFEDSPLPLYKWAMAFWMFTAGKKGCAALELMRVLQVTYETAWYMGHRNWLWNQRV